MSPSVQLSVIVPHHNRPQMLQDLVASIPADARIEIIIIDDHSNTLPAEISHPGVRLLALPDGVRYAGPARNMGLKVATGEWVLFADSDDLFDTAGFNELLEVLSFASEDVVYMPVDAFRDDGSTATRHLRTNAALKRARSGDAGALLRLYAPWSKAIRKDLIDKHNIRFEDVRYSNDVIFSLKVAIASRQHRILDTAIYRIREGNASLTSAISSDSIAQRLDVLHRYNDILRATGHGSRVVPAIGQLKKIALRSPWAFLRLALRTLFRGDPVLIDGDRFRRATCKIRPLNQITHP